MRGHTGTPMQVLVFLLLLCFVPAVILDAAARETGVLSRGQQEEIVQKIAELLENNYVSSEIGKLASERLLAEQRKGGYSHLRSPREFADGVNADLAEWSKDKHLNVVYDPDWVRQMRAMPAEDAYLTVEMIAEERAKNFGFKRVEILDGNIGYLDLRIFFHPKYAGPTAVAAMNLLSDCEAVIIDLRNNGGGWGDMVSFLCSYFLDNEEIVHLNSVYSRPENRYCQSWTSPYVPGRIMVNTPLYILTSRSTFSAAEEFCYNLKFLKRSKIVGERTRGGAHPITPKILNDELILIVPESASIHPVTKGNWEGVGVEPDIAVSVEYALDTAYLSALDELRSSAVNDKRRVVYQWYADAFRAKRNPAVVDVKTLKSYTGTYGTLKIAFRDGSLFYQRGDRAMYRMIPMSETLFLVDEQSTIRIRIKKDRDRTIGITVLHSDGGSVDYTRVEE